LASSPLASFSYASLRSQASLYSGTLAYTYSVASDDLLTMSAKSIVAEMMILANWTVSKFCTEHSLPVPYRGSAAPKSIAMAGGLASGSLDDLMALRLPNTGIVDYYALRAFNLYFPPGELSFDSPTPHWAMGLDSYLRATSPLRRFDDLIVHWQLKSYLATQKTVFDRQEVEQLARRGELGQKKVKRADISAGNHWRTKVIHDQLWKPRTDGQEGVDLKTHVFKAKVVDSAVFSLSSKTRSVDVYLEQLGLVSSLHYDASGVSDWRIGQEVNVVVERTETQPRPTVISRLA
ncbi:hypothetical protein P7C73_g6505, partial [Tremellales sp. Uapishka_1]